MVSLTSATFTALTGIDEVRATGASNFNVEAPLFAGITRFDSGDTAAMPARSMVLHGEGATFDFTNKVLVGFGVIQVADDNQVLTFNDKTTALLVKGEAYLVESVVLTVGIFEDFERQKLVTAGIDFITDGSGTTDNRKIMPRASTAT